MPEKSTKSEAQTGVGSTLPRNQRVAAVIVGALAVGGGVVAVFLTDNQAGTAALFVIGAVFLTCGVFDLQPSKFSIKDGTVELGRAAIATVERLATDADPEVRDKVVETLGDELESRGVSRTDQQLAVGVINGFVRAGSEQAREIADALQAAGWLPASPPKSRYVRWAYSGGNGLEVSLYQNVNNLAVNREALKKVVQDLPGATLNGRDVLFAYGAETDDALRAAASLRSYADN